MQEIQGLSAVQVRQKTAAGETNKDVGIKTKSEKQIVLQHVFTFFNLLNFFLAILLLVFGSVRNVLFMGVVLSNIGIGIFQEIRAKRTIDKLSLLSQPQVTVLRDGVQQEIPVHALVKEDVVLLHSGDQICADAVLLQGSCEINESLLTGESEPVAKESGDELLSGSFVVSGQCMAKVIHVGEENYSYKIAADAKYLKRPQSEILYWTNKIIWFFGLCVLPVGGLLFGKHFFLSHESFSESVTAMAASMIGMIPEGLVLLTSVVFAASVLRLAKYKTLVQELSCVETLARVDVLCLDKTGTITEGNMQVDALLPLEDESEEQVRQDLCILCNALQDDTPTISAIRAAFGGKNTVLHADDIHPFSSEKKWSGAHFSTGGTLLLGAGEALLGEDFAPLRETAAQYTQNGQRVVLLAGADTGFCGKELPELLFPKALIVLSDRIRAGAAKTLQYFQQQQVDIRIISGDDPQTVSAIAKRAGVPDAENAVNMRQISGEEALFAAAQTYRIFGRVTPGQKLQLIKALKAQGHTVAMTGDGVNDVLALKEADCSIAMSSGSDAARTVANLVLLHSDFSALPHVVAEGRRTINNLQRSAALFIVKNLFTMLASLLFLILPFSYPFQPIQFTLISAFTIGAPSLLLGLEPNKERIRGKFIVNVVRKALPAAVAMILNLVIVCCISHVAGFSEEQLSTLAVMSTALCGLCMLARVSVPFNWRRGCILACATAGILLGCTLLQKLFLLEKIGSLLLVAFLPTVLFTLFCFPALSHITDTKLTRFFDAIERKIDNRKHHLPIPGSGEFHLKHRK